MGKIQTIVSLTIIVLLVSVPLISQNVYPFSCKEKWVTYRVDVEVRTEDNRIMPGAFVRCYPDVNFKIHKGSFNRANNNGIAMVYFETCTEYGPLPDVVKAQCVVTDRWDGEYYKADRIKVKLHKTRSKTSVYSALLRKKGTSQQKYNKNKIRKQKNHNGNINGTYSCGNGSEIKIIVRPDGSWSASNNRFSLFGGGGFNAAEKAAKKLCRQ